MKNVKAGAVKNEPEQDLEEVRSRWKRPLASTRSDERYKKRRSQPDLNVSSLPDDEHGDCSVSNDDLQQQLAPRNPQIGSTNAEHQDWWSSTLAGPPTQHESKKLVARSSLTVMMKREYRMKLDIDNFTGCGDQQVEWWLLGADQAAERQRVLGGEVWTPLELYYGVSEHLKDDAERWFCRISIPTKDRTFKHLATLLKRRFGRHENMYQTQMRMARRMQQPGERLDDLAANLRNIGVVHAKLPDYWYGELYQRDQQQRFC
ncbi:hypothetical protein V7S43_014489 [Phytophthora oleae]|uniref:Retrotransposon gag domain-containing protein n=1 Tax=Phytophthora oleae TaxID=2107226 RepID=A0ABD3F2R6_9STRA